MAWETLKTDYTDAIWVGKKRYNQITNSDGTLSFDDVTEYSQKENSFYGADDANSTNEAINYIMKALENDTDLYTDFKAYFDNQKTAFSSTGETMMRDLQEGYQARIEAYESEQEDTFEEWIATLKAKLDSTDVAKLQSEIEALETSSKVTLTDNGSTSSYAKTYTISQGGSSIGTINIPKDLVVTSGSVVKNPTSSLTGTYIKLVIANQTDPLYINVADLCDVYTGGSTATVQVSVSSTNQITASIVNGSISKTMLDSSVQSTLNQVATNKTNIATNTTNIATNKTNIATNTTNIATNKTNIATNTTNINSLKTTVSSHTSSIGSLNTTIAKKASKNWTYLNGSENGATVTINANYENYSEYMISVFTTNSRVLASTIISSDVFLSKTGDASNGYHQVEYKNGSFGGGISRIKASQYKMYSWAGGGYVFCALYAR